MRFHMLKNIKWLEDMEVVKLRVMMNIKPKSKVDIAQGKDMDNLGLMCSMSFDQMNSPNDEMTLMLAPLKMTKEDGMKVFLLVQNFYLHLSTGMPYY